MSRSPSRAVKAPAKSKAAKSVAKPKPSKAGAKASRPARAVARPAKAAKKVAKAPARKPSPKAATAKPVKKKAAAKAAAKPVKKVAKAGATRPARAAAAVAMTPTAVMPVAAVAPPAPVIETRPVEPPPVSAAGPSQPRPTRAPEFAQGDRGARGDQRSGGSGGPPPGARGGQGPEGYRESRPPQQNQQQQQHRSQERWQGGGGSGGGPSRPDQRPPQPQQHQPQGQGRPPFDRDRRDGRGGGGGGGGGGGSSRGPQPQTPPRPQQQQPPHAQNQPRPSGPVGGAEPASRGPAPVAAAPAHPDHHHVPAGPTHPGRDEIFERNMRFADLGLRDSVLKGITEAGFEFPTAIQARIIPVILSGKDVLGQAKTGTGKTAAFGLPLLHRIEKGVPFQALVLVPTRELAIQVATDLKELGRFTPLHILPVYGGQNVSTQAQLLAKGPEIIVATPGRVMDMVQRGHINYRSIKAVVLDEVDRMLDIGFRDDIRRILSGCPRDRQTVFVSATINPEIEALARSFARECEKIVASAGSLTVSMVKQWHLPVQPWDKKQLLLHLLTHEDPALTVIFCRTKKTVDNIAEYLTRKGVECFAIHGDMYQNKRNKVIERLKAGKLEVLVASDVASRGLDVEGISHVINYDLPEDPDLYVHRIGRTARAGRDGVAWSLVTPEQGGMLTEIELLINAEIPKLDYPDFKPGPVPSDVLHRQQSDQRRVENARQFNRFSSVPAPAGGAGTGGGGGAGSGGSAGGASSPAGGGAGGAGAPGGGGPARIAAPAPQADPNRFPGGIVPTMAPPKRMFGKVKTARSMKAAIQQAYVPPAAAPAPAEGAPAAAPPAGA